MKFMNYVKHSDILDTRDATATAGDILKDKTAYVNGEKIVGTNEGSKYNALITKYTRTGSTLFNIKWYIGELDLTNVDLSYVNTSKKACENIFSDYYELVKVKGLNLTGMTSMKSMYYCCYKLQEPCIPNTSQVTTMYQMFNSCFELKIAPEMDTGNVTNMYEMFGVCKELTTVPVYNTSKVTDMSQMFTACSKLSNESLNNILAMCITATNCSNKKLSNLGITSAQATVCKSLSNYQAFLDAGWTTGY